MKHARAAPGRAAKRPGGRRLFVASGRCDRRWRRVSRAFRIVRGQRHRLPRIEVAAHRVELPARQVQREPAKQQPQRWPVRQRGVDDRLRAAHRIARLAAAASGGLPATLPGRRGVVGDVGLGVLDRRARPVGAERPRLDDEHVDAQRLHLDRERLRHALDRVLRAVVVARRGEAREAADRRHVHDQAAALPAHDGKHRLRHVDQAEDVRLEHRAHGAVLTFLDRREIAVAGVVDERIDATEALHGLGDGVVDLLAPGDVERQDERPVVAVRGDVRKRRGSRAVTTARQPRASTSCASARPKPVEQPVINQTGLSRFIISESPVQLRRRQPDVRRNAAISRSPDPGSGSVKASRLY